jgi:two-component system cell cycle response regulator CtrA
MRVLLIEDDPVKAVRIPARLGREHWRCDVLPDGEDIERGELDYDIVLLEQGQGGDEVLRRLRRARIGLPVLMLATATDLDSRLAALGAGADDVLARPFDGRELVARMLAIVRRTNGHAEPAVCCGPIAVDLVRRCVTVTPDGGGAPVEVHLTRRQFGLVEVMAMRPGKVVTKEAFMSHLYDAEAGDEPDVKIIDVYICKIRQALRKVSPLAAECLVTSWGRGYLLQPPPRISQAGSVPVQLAAAA